MRRLHQLLNLLRQLDESFRNSAFPVIEMKSESGLRLDRREDLLRGGDRGPALTPQSPLQSLLIRTIDGSDPDLEMPPEKPLRRSDVETLRSWLEHGAPAWSDDPHSSVSESNGDAWSDPNNPIARKFGVND